MNTEYIIELLREMAEYSDANQNGNCGGFDTDYIRDIADRLEKEN